MKKKIENRILALMVIMLISPFAYGNDLLIAATADLLKERTTQVKGLVDSVEHDNVSILMAEFIEKELELEINVFVGISSRLDFMALDKLQKSLQEDDTTAENDVVYLDTRLTEMNLKPEVLVSECEAIRDTENNVRAQERAAGLSTEKEKAGLAISKDTLYLLANICGSYKFAKISIESKIEAAMNDQKALFMTSEYADWIRIQEAQASALEQVLAAQFLDKQLRDTNTATNASRSTVPRQSISIDGFINPHIARKERTHLGYKIHRLSYSPDQK